MKKYNKPEIEALALETIDVIAASDATDTTYAQLNTEIADAGTGVATKAGDVTISQFTTGWNW